MIKVNIEQGSEDWFDNRIMRVTGTRFQSLVAGFSTASWKDLIVDISGEILTKIPVEERYKSQEMQDGVDREPDARIQYAEEFGVDVSECGFIMPDEDHEWHEWIGISPDGIVGDDEYLIEIKSPTRKVHMNRILKGEGAKHYKHQIQGQLFTTGMPFIDFISYYPGLKLYVERVYPDPDIHALYNERLDILRNEVNAVLEIYKSYNYEGLAI